MLQNYQFLKNIKCIIQLVYQVTKLISERKFEELVSKD